MILNHLSQAGNFTEKDKNALIAAIHEQNKSKYDKVDRITEYQKYVNTELDSCFCKLITEYAPVVGEIVPFQKVSGSMEIQDGLITVKPGQRVHIDIVLSYAGTQSYANVLYTLKDITNNIVINDILPYQADSRFEYAYCTHCQYTNETSKDCQLALYVTEVLSADVLNYSFSSLTVQEIGRAITIDPLEHVNAQQGIEDTPVGHIISHMGTVAPKHYLICDGTEYNIADYPYLAQHMIDNFGSVNYFGGDGETTFAVPDLRNRFLKGSDEAGVNEEAGLPNITANWKSEPSTDAYGAVYTVKEKGTLQAVSDGGSTDDRVYFDASRSSPIYGNSDTVTPENTSVLYCIKYEPTYFMTNYNTNYMQLNQYSEEEQVIGCWIDGKPIYRKVFIDTAPEATTNGTFVWKNFELGCSVDTGFPVRGTGLTTHEILTLPHTSNDGTARLKTALNITSGTVGIGSNSTGWNGLPIMLIAEYTKTTDAENSFTNDMIQDYTTAEPYSDAQVINAIDTLWQ